MIRTLDEWYEHASERGTRGDMVYDILSDWRENTNKPLDNIITYGDGQEVRYGIHTVFVLDYHELDKIIKVEFPFLNWQGIIAEEEMNNDTTKEFVDVGPPKYSLDQEDVAELLAGKKPRFGGTSNILKALVVRKVIPPGDYLIRVSW